MFLTFCWLSVCLCGNSDWLAFSLLASFLCLNLCLYLRRQRNTCLNFPHFYFSVSLLSRLCFLVCVLCLDLQLFVFRGTRICRRFLVSWFCMNLETVSIKADSLVLLPFFTLQTVYRYGNCHLRALLS